MELPASLRELNPVVDGIARGERPADGPALRLAVALGLVTPDGSLSEAGRAYARPVLAAGPTSLVMDPGRRTAAEGLLAGPLPLPSSLRRLLRRIRQEGEALVAPLALGWPEPVLRPYLAYLEDMGLLVQIGPLVEVTPRGRGVAALPDPVPVWPAPVPPADPPAGEPDLRSAVFRYHLARRVSMDLITLRGRREWHLLQPLLDGPLADMLPAYTEWLHRFQSTLAAGRRIWAPDLVAQFESAHPAPERFAAWCRALLGVDPADAVAALTASPGLLLDHAVLAGGSLSRETWLLATALSRAARQGRAVRYAAAAARFALDGITLPPWPEMHGALEAAGLLVTDQPEIRLLVPVEVAPPAGAIWPYAAPEWLMAALAEGGAFGPPSHVRRLVRV